MFKLYCLLFYEFSKIGAFAIGGGYAALPFLFYIQSQYNWFSTEELTNMIAIANLTPGPIGINMATYAGYKTAGIIGAVIATVAIVFVPFILTIIITKLFNKFHSNKEINYIFTGLRPAACALLASISIKLFLETVSFKNVQNFDTSTLILFVIMIIPLIFFKKNPVLTILIGAIGGVLSQYLS